jgi:hypothetical protein
MSQPDEHMTLPTWRVRQLQDIEGAATEAVELIAETSPHDRSRLADLTAEVRALLENALESHQ